MKHYLFFFFCIAFAVAGFSQNPANRLPIHRFEAPPDTSKMFFIVTKGDTCAYEYDILHIDSVGRVFTIIVGEDTIRFEDQTGSGSQTLSNVPTATTHTVTLSSGGGSIQLVEGSKISLTTTGTSSDGIVTITALETDGNVANEGVLGVSAGSGTSSVITSNTAGATGVTMNAAGILSISETTSSNGGQITITGTEVDGSTTNELQTLSWAAGSGGNDQITLSNGGGTVTITDDVNDADASATNELQTLSINLSGSQIQQSISSGNTINWTPGLGFGLAGQGGNADPLRVDTNDIATQYDLTQIVAGAFATSGGVTSNSPGDEATDDFVFGSTTLDYLDAGTASRFFFDNDKNAFFAGTSNSTSANNSNRGLGSMNMGTTNQTEGLYTGAYAGQNNLLESKASYSGILAGASNRIDALYGGILAGENNQVDSGADYGSAKGRYAQSHLYGQTSHSNGGLLNPGRSQYSRIIASASASGFVTYPLYLDGSSYLAVLYENSAWGGTYDCMTIVTNAGSTSAEVGDWAHTLGWFTAVNIAGTVTVQYAENGGSNFFIDSDSDMLDATIILSADTVNDAMKIESDVPTLVGIGFSTNTVCVFEYTQTDW